MTTTKTTKTTKTTATAAAAVDTPVVEQPTTTQNNIVIDAAMPAPGIDQMRARKATKYPYEQLEAPFEQDGQKMYYSFMVPDKTAQNLQSSISAWNTQYSKPCPSGQTRLNAKGEQIPVKVYDRKFKAVNVEGGVRVYRIV